VPARVGQLSIDALTEEHGLPRGLARRVQQTKALWLLVAHRDTIARIHPADCAAKARRRARA
jgi:hypothetical protein